MDLRITDETKTFITLDFSGTEKKFADIDELREFMQSQKSAWSWLEHVAQKGTNLVQMWGPFKWYFIRAEEFINQYRRHLNNHDKQIELVKILKVQTQTAVEQGFIMDVAPDARFVLGLKERKSPQIAAYVLAFMNNKNVTTSNLPAYEGAYWAMKYRQGSTTDSTKMQQEIYDSIVQNWTTRFEKQHDYLGEKNRQLIKKIKEVETKQEYTFEKQTTKHTSAFEKQTTKHTSAFENQMAMHTRTLEMQLAKQTSDFRNLTTAQAKTFDNLIAKQVGDFKSHTIQKLKIFENQTAEQASAFGNMTTEQAKVFESQTGKQECDFKSQTTQQSKIFEKQTTEQSNAFGKQTTEQANAFENQTIEQANAFGKQTTKQANTFESLTAKQASDFGNLTTKQANTFESLTAKQASDFEITLDETRKKLADFQAHLNEKVALEESVEYWTKKRAKHEAATQVAAYRTIVIAGSTLVAFILVAIIILVTTEDEVSPVKISILVALSTFGVWITRLSAKIFISNLHLGADAYERVTMFQTYFALLAEGKGLNDDNREIILQTLFRPSSSGIIKDDGPTSALETLVKALKRR